MKLSLAVVSIIAFLIVDCRDVSDGRERHDSAGEPQQLKETTNERERRETIDKVLNQVFIQKTDAALPDVNEDGYADDHGSSSAESIFESFMSKRSIDTASNNRLRRSHKPEPWCPRGFVPIGDCCYWFSCDQGLRINWDYSALVCEAIGASIGRDVGLADLCDDECCTSHVPLMEAIAAKGESCWLGTRYEDPNWVCTGGNTLSIKNPFWSNDMPTPPFTDTCMMAWITGAYSRAYFGNDQCTADHCFVCQLF